MEDGSIFVCFLCEKEFRQVSLLQEHMKDHGTLPEMSEDFPSRRKGSSKENNKEEKKVRTYGSSKKQKTTSNSSSEQSKKSGYSISNSNIDIDKIIKIKTEPSTSSESTSIRGTKGSPLTKSIVINQAPKPKTPAKSVIPSKIHVKAEPDDFSLAMQRAMKIKKYIERKENKAKEKVVVVSQMEPEDEMHVQEMEYEGTQESIMMVDSSFFTSGSSKTPIGPTIMNAEPDGFMVPQKISLGKQSQNQKRKRKSNFMNDNFIIQEVFYDTEKGEEEEVEEEDDEDDDDSENSESNISNHVQVFRNYGLQVNNRGRGRGRGRGKRGRPAKIKEEQIDEEIRGYYKVNRSGQRSKPKVNAEDPEFGSTFQCLECYKEFRTVSTMRVHMKTHAEDKEIPCPYCDEVFPQRYILYEHLINDHEESSSLTCPVCNKIFTRPDSLKSHMVRMHEENGGLNCFVCGKSFPSQGQLEIHVRVHTGERPFKCDICKKGFVQKAHLRTHLRTMHNMTEANTTPCRICLKKFDGRAALRDHFTNEHGLNTAQYKNQVAKLRKEGKIPEVLPPKIRVVDPSFRYQKVSVSEVNDDAINLPQPDVSTSSTTVNGTNKEEKETSVYLTQRAGRKLKIKTKLNKSSSKTPGMGTVMNLASDDVMFTPVNFNLDDDQPKGRDQEELNIVESAFKVAEEMDHLKDGSSATILMTDGSSSSGIYYTLPIDMPEDADDEYAQFAAEHAHIGLDHDENEIDSAPSTGFVSPSGTTSNSKGSRKGAIVKAEPLEIYSDNMETVQAIEMLTM
ncbi:UNVERIFIED_CONTAM: hypothetical protein RMT77_003451 [Armadillidium vulgare]